MKRGTRSLLFGVHQFLWHPLTVLLAWRKLYGMPSLSEAVCIMIHDWGYWGSPDMDGKRGERHPAVAGYIARRLFHSRTMQRMVLFHSRSYCKKTGSMPSPLCWADKYSITYERWWTYIPRAWLSGEIQEYRRLSAENGLPPTASNKEWFFWIQSHYSDLSATYQTNRTELATKVTV